MEMHQDNSATYLDMSKHVTDMEKEWFFLLAGRQQLESFLKLWPLRRRPSTRCAMRIASSKSRLGAPDRIIDLKMSGVEVTIC